MSSADIVFSLLQIDGVSLLCASMKHWIDQGEHCPHVVVSTHFHSIVHQHLLPRSPLIKYLVGYFILNIVICTLVLSKDESYRYLNTVGVI